MFVSFSSCYFSSSSTAIEGKMLDIQNLNFFRSSIAVSILCHLHIPLAHTE